MATQASIPQDLDELLRRLNEIGVALSAERDLYTLLELILTEARRFTGADAGTLYLAKDDHLTFEIAHNDTLKTFMGGRRGSPANVPPVPMNRESVSGFAAVTGVTLNIADVYDESGQYQFEGPKNYDRMSGYHTKSMLGVPMADHEDQVIGVLQLLNATDQATGEVIPFSAADESMIQSLASQAAVAINNVRLIEETERLFESFVKVMATAIDERSPYTGGHIRRVAEMTMAVADAVNQCKDGPLAELEFSADELNELRIAAWMHDIGKITTPEWVVDKPTKLTTIHDRIELLRTRFELIGKTIETEMLRQKTELLEAGQPLADDFEHPFRERMATVANDFAFLEKANLPGEFMGDDDQKRLLEIRARYADGGETDAECLSDEELENLSISKGSLTDQERQKINDHASMSIKMLEQIPFTRKLAEVPAIAGAHHEKLNGKGYPRGLKGDDISLQARILALVDIFESLSANDRPYRAKPMARETVLRILREEVDNGHIDGRIFELFEREQLFLKLDEIKAQEERQK